MRHLETRTISLSGVATRVEDVLRIASKLDGDTLARKLERAIANHNTHRGAHVRRSAAVPRRPRAGNGFVELQDTLRSQIQRYPDSKVRGASAPNGADAKEPRDWNAAMRDPLERCGVGAVGEQADGNLLVGQCEAACRW